MSAKESILHVAWFIISMMVYVIFLFLRHLVTLGFLRKAGTPPAQQAKAQEGAREHSLNEIISQLGIDMSMKTDPDLVQDILEKDMLMADLDDAEEIFGDKMSVPWDASKFLGDIREGIIARAPVLEYADMAYHMNLIPEANKEVLTRALHHTILLEDLTQAMADSEKTMRRVLEHAMKKREGLGIKRSFIQSTLKLRKVTGSLFEVAKIKTMDWVFEKYVEIRERGYIASLKERQTSLIVNIIEAMLTERRAGFKANARTAFALGVNPFDKCSVAKEPDHSRFIFYEFNSDWTDLYESWNLAFVTGNEENLHLIYPKLFIPSVMCAPHNRYLFNRVLSLWATANFVIFAKAQKPKRPLYDLAGKRDMAVPWGVMNAEYATAYVKEYNHANLNSFWDRFKLTLKTIFRSPESAPKGEPAGADSVPGTGPSV